MKQLPNQSDDLGRSWKYWLKRRIKNINKKGKLLSLVEVKRKEISIRKIVGADKKQLIQILSKGFVILLLVAGFIAMPIGFILSTLFLQNFAERISFGLIHLMGCLILMFSIGLVTVLSQT
jgi:putative ABC transport system permease protein